jgi:uncharacterized repeat protein (TIGR01451 family)
MIGGSRSVMDFTFECEGGDGATMSSYSYLREPSLQDSGYARGLKAGSFNYLVNGTIDVREVIKYKSEDKDGYYSDNSTYSHKMEVDFKGEKSISEFYAKEYFKNNKAIAAWKKIKYEDIKPKWKLGQSNMAKEIHVVSGLLMDTTPGKNGTGYSLNYKAKIKGGVIETRDALGWSNRTGARKTLWEHNAVMRGNVNVTNILKESGPIVVHGGFEDWLPCFCFTGTMPPNERMYTKWPSQKTINILRADTIPNQSITTDGEFGIDETSSIIASELLNNETVTNGFFIENTYSEDVATKQVIYEIRIKNMGDIKVRSLNVVDTLPSNMRLSASSYKYEEDGILEEPTKLLNSDGTTTLTWSIGDIDSGKWKTIQMVVYAGESNSRPELNKVVATGLALGIAVEATSDGAEPEIISSPDREGSN